MEVRALTSADAATIASWRYPGRYSTYDFDDPPVERYDPERLRLYILEWNERSRKVAASHGFAVESVLASDEGPFLVMTRRTLLD